MTSDSSKRDDTAALLERVTPIAVRSNFDPARMVLDIKRAIPEVDAARLNEVIEVLLARRRAERLGAWTEHGLFSRRNLEQASRLEVATHHAARFAGCSHVLEIGTGLGSDTAALAQIVARVTTLEADEVTARYARHNLALRGVTNVEVRHATLDEARAFLDLTEFDGLWCDPSRRDSEGRRLSSVEEYHPPLSSLLALPINGRCGIKLSPGASLEALPEGWHREFLGVGKECIEQTIWRGVPLRDGTVTLVDSGEQWIPQNQEASTPTRIPAVGDVLIEPHAALVRCGYLAQFFAAHDIALLDRHIAYGVRREPLPPSPWLEQFRVLEVLGFHVKRLRARLRELGWDSRTEFKKRGIEQDPNELWAAMKLPPPKRGAPRFGTVILTRVGQEHLVYLTTRIVSSEEATHG